MSQQTAAAPGRTSPAQRHARLLALLVAGTFFMENLDGTVIATALPQMARTFHMQAVDLSIGMTAYLLTLAVFIPISGWIADRFGARSVFAGAIGVFTLASLLCGISNGLWSFTGARIVQGVGGAMMVPVGRLVVLRHTEKPDLLRAIAYLTWPGLIAPVLGPPVGGFITTYASWRWIFLLNLPLGLLALSLALIFIANDRRDDHRPFDAVGFVLGGAALAALMYGFELFGRTDAPWLQAALFAGGGLLGGTAAVWHARRHPHPLLDFSALSVPSFAVSIWGGSLFRISIGTVPFLVPLLLQLGFGLSAFASGLLILALFAGNLAIKPLTTPMLRRWGFRKMLIANGVGTAASIAACALFTPNTPFWAIAAVLFVGGICRSTQFTCLTTLSFSEVTPPMMSGASTLSSMVQQLSMGLGIAFGAISLRAGALLGGGTSLAPRLADFRIAFALVAVVALLAVLDCLPLDRHAGAAISGHRQAR